jgi:hypothetical protein
VVVVHFAVQEAEPSKKLPMDLNNIELELFMKYYFGLKQAGPGYRR